MDASGSTMALTGAAGATNQTTTLDPWGAVESQTGTSGNRELFTGHRTDAETGLVYMGARYYDPALGQFTTADSYPGEPSEPGSMQRYTFPRGKPATGEVTGSGVSVRERFGKCCREAQVAVPDDVAAFADAMLAAYRADLLPVGWMGRWPAGNLIVAVPSTLTRRER